MRNEGRVPSEPDPAAADGRQFPNHDQVEVVGPASGIRPEQSGAFDYLSTDHLTESIGQRTVASAKWTLLAQLAKVVLQVVSIAVLARLLEPEDFGLVAMVTVLTGLLAPFADGGLSMATIQRRDLSQGQVSGLFWINCVLGAFLCLVVAAAAPLLATLYGEPDLLLTTMVLSLVFPLSSVSLQSVALLKRQMRYGITSAVDVASLAVGIAAAILLALAGLGHWALVAMTLVSSCLASLLLFTLCGWLPSRPARASELRPLLIFGLNMTGADFIGRASTSLTPFAVGLVGGPQQLGLFNRALTIVSLPTSQLLPPIMSVATPALARVAQDPARFRRAVESLLRKALVPSVFITLIIAVHADWLVHVALGSDWVEATSYIRLIAVLALVQPVSSIVSAAVIANGHPGAMLRWNVISFVIHCGAAGIGMMWGALGIVAAIAISGVTLRLFGFLLFAAGYLPLSARLMAGVFRPYALIVPIMLAWCLTASYLLASLPPLWALLVSTFLSMTFYTGLVLAMNETRREAKAIFELVLRSRRPRLAGVQ